MYGFVFILDRILTKAYLPRKTIDWRSNRTYIAAVSGSPQDHTPFLAPDDVVTGDNLFLLEPTKLHKSVKTAAVGKYLKENRKKLEGLPEIASTDAKAKNLRIAAFPVILPMVKGLEFDEGPLDTTDIYEKFEKSHPLYEDFLHFKLNTSPINHSFFETEQDCPQPDTFAPITMFYDLPMKVLFKHNHSNCDAYSLLKGDIAKFLPRETPRSSPNPTVPREVAVSDNPTVVTTASTQNDDKTVEKNEKIIAFLQIFFARPEYDRSGNITTLHPGVLTDEALELLSSSTTISEQARNLTDALDAFASQVKHERMYLSRGSDFPYISETVAKFMLQAHFFPHGIDKNLEGIKKSFNLLALLPPPTTDEYQRYINSSKNSEVESLLDQPQDKRSAVKKDIFTKGKQESLDDVVAFIGNVLIFARFWIQMSDESSSQPLLIQMFLEIADHISSQEYTDFHDKWKEEKKFMPHTLVSYLFNIASVFTKMAKDPSTVRKYKIDGHIEPGKLRVATIMTSSLLNNLQVCSATSSPQVLFAHAPSSLKNFCPHLVVTEPSSESGKKRLSPTDKDRDDKWKQPKQTTGSILNTTSKRLFFPKGLKNRYCADYLDTNSTCRHGKNCTYLHAVWPTDFHADDIKIMRDHVSNTEGYSFATTDKKVS